jgi:pyruvate dehydrogenase E2 component (dihydrolipoamide acetyltransferase)
MTRSKREIPHYYLATTVEIEPAIDWLADRNRERAASERLVLAALLIKAVALAAREFPELNGHWRDGSFHPSEAVHVGMVVSLRDGGLVVPPFADADQRTLEDTMAALRDVVGRARAGRLRSRELGDATITITSLGDDGVESIFGVIYPPQVAIVGFGGIHQALRVEGRLHGTQPVLRATLSADHRASDGQRGSRFLQSISQRLRNPEQL